MITMIGTNKLLITGETIVAARDLEVMLDPTAPIIVVSMKDCTFKGNGHCAAYAPGTADVGMMSEGNITDTDNPGPEEEE